LCLISKNLLNYANYMIRQQFFATGEYLNYYSIQRRCQGTLDYIALPANVAPQVLLRLHESWQSFLAANQEYKKHPEKFQYRHKIPKYKHKKMGRNIVNYTAQAVSKTALKRIKERLDSSG
jgi:putative transposase